MRENRGGHWASGQALWKRAYSARQMHNTLEVIGLRKQIDEMQLLDPVAGTEQNHQIARQRDRIA